MRKRSGIAGPLSLIGRDATCTLREPALSRSEPDGDWHDDAGFCSPTKVADENKNLMSGVERFGKADALISIQIRQHDLSVEAHTSSV